MMAIKVINLDKQKAHKRIACILTKKEIKGSKEALDINSKIWIRMKISYFENFS